MYMYIVISLVILLIIIGTYFYMNKEEDIVIDEESDLQEDFVDFKVTGEDVNNMQRIITKYPFKNIIDKQKLYQNKMTIADPQSFWLRNSLKELVNDTFNSNNFSCAQIFNKNFVKQYYFDYCKEKEKHINSFFLLQILLTELWFKNILNNNS